MARQSKKLKFDLTENKLSKNDTRVHFDREDDLLAEEHYGYYLMSTPTSAGGGNINRVYLSSKHREEYIDKKRNGKKTKTPQGALYLFNNHFNYLSLIKNTIDIIFTERLMNGQTRKYINGFNIFLDSLRVRRRHIESFNEIGLSDVNHIIEYIESLRTFRKEDYWAITYFLHQSSLINSFVKNKLEEIKETIDAEKENNGSNLALPSSVIYQLGYHIKIEFEELKVIADNKQKWLAEYSNGSYMSKENILKTMFDYLEDESIKNQRQTLLLSLLLYKLKIDFNTDIGDFICIPVNKVRMYGKIKRKQYFDEYNKYKEMSDSGTNLLSENKEKFSLYWLIEIFPDYPYVKEPCEQYSKIVKNMDAFKQVIRNTLNIDNKKVDKYVFPMLADVYPMYLYTLIQVGANQENIQDIRTFIDGDGNIKILGDDLGLFTVVDTLKKRANKEISITIQNDSMLYKYFSTYMTLYSDVYKRSKANHLFQYVKPNPRYNKQPIKAYDRPSTMCVLKSPESFYEKYEIFDIDGTRIKILDHRLIRKSHTYQDYLKGKGEFERQQRKNHDSGITTKKYYENQNIEWREVNRHKIALAQNLVVGIFKGEITREEHKTAKLFYGPLADCKDNKNPSYDNAPVMKDNEFCTDWTKCLICNKSKVITKIHGPLIYAWIDYMEQQRKEEFLRDADWEKEFKLDHYAAKDAVSHFTEEEKAYCNKEKFKHKEFIRMKFSKTVKTKGLQYA